MQKFSNDDTDNSNNNSKKHLHIPVNLVFEKKPELQVILLNIS